jgi:hypothetical protein
VFDPLAVLLLIASQYTFELRRKENPSLEKSEPTNDPAPQPLGGFEGFDTVPFGVDSSPYSHNRQTTQQLEEVENENLYEAMDKDIQETEPETTPIDVYDFSALEPSIEEARQAFESWEISNFEKRLEKEVSAEKDQVVEPVSEPISKDPAFLQKIEDTKQAFKEYYGDNPQEPEPEADGLNNTFEKLRDSEYYIDPQGKQIHENALKSAHPELFLQSDSGARQAGTSFGTTFPMIAIKGDIFVRVDQMPNRVYKFEGKSWIEIDKATTDSYTFDEEYIEYIISQIKSGEYDIDLLSDSERIQVETYLTKNSG